MTQYQAYHIINQLAPEVFEKMCRNVLIGLGFKRARNYDTTESTITFRVTLRRESADRMFRTEENWLIVFGRTHGMKQALDGAIAKTAQKAGIEFLLVVVFDDIAPTIVDTFFQQAVSAKISPILLTGDLAVCLARDYAPGQFTKLPIPSFSFENVRKSMREQSETAPWHDRFQALKALPTRVTPGTAASVLQEADVFRATSKTHSYLLLGNPGAGKTTSLIALAAGLSAAGGRTPIVVPLNQYEGDLLKLLSLWLGEENNPLPNDIVQALLISGSLVVMLDGLNEVHPDYMLKKLVEEINHFTNPEEQTSRSQWIVTYRKYDYQQASKHNPLEHLEKNPWELQPLTADLIYRFLNDELGEGEGKSVYDKLGDTVREICRTPLLLNMLVTLYRDSNGHIPTRKGALYRRFIDLLLDWGERPTEARIKEQISGILGVQLSQQSFHQLTIDALIALTKAMTATAISWEDAKKAVSQVFELSSNPLIVANKLLQYLLTKTLLKRRGVYISFFHHTFQEYFQAFSMKDLTVEELIPEQGVEGVNREAVVFFAGLTDRPDLLIERALKVDIWLAYEMARDVTLSLPNDLLHRIAKVFWDNTLVLEGRTNSWVGSQYEYASAFKYLVEQTGQNLEQFARQVTPDRSDVAFLEELLQYYQELGDVNAQSEIVKRLENESNKEYSDSLIFRMAVAASGRGDNLEAVKLYTDYLQSNPSSDAAFGNRANVFEGLGKIQEAISDYEKSLELNQNAYVSRANFATLLINQKQIGRARLELERAVSLNPNYAPASFHLANLLEMEQPEAALPYYERAATDAIHPAQILRYSSKLAEIQEKTADYTGAIRSLYRLIELEPTSKETTNRKKKIAMLRLKQDEIAKQRTIREQLLERSEVPLYTLVETFLRAASYDIQHPTSRWMIAQNIRPSQYSILGISLIDSPQLSAGMIREAVDTLPPEGRDAAHAILFTNAETLEFEARMQLTAYQPERNIAIITELEVAEAILDSDRACYNLVLRAMQRTSQRDPFKFTAVVEDTTNFYGRTRNITYLLDQIANHKPIALYGIHKIGKSSLLRRVQQRVNAYMREITPVWIELDATVKDGNDLFRLVLEKLSIDITNDHRITIETFRSRLRQFHEREMQKRVVHSILLIIDEYPYMIPDSFGRNGLNDYIEILGMFKSLQQEGWFNFLPCGRSSALSRTVQWPSGENPFVGIFQESFLGPLSEEETREMVVTLGKRAGIVFKDEALARIYSLTNGHPLFARTLGSWILSGKKKREISPDVVDEAAEAYLADRGDRTLLKAISINNLDIEEQRIVRELAHHSTGIAAGQLLSPNASQEDRERLVGLLNNLVDTTLIIREIREEKQHVRHRYELLRRAVVLDIKETLNL